MIPVSDVCEQSAYPATKRFYLFECHLICLLICLSTVYPLMSSFIYVVYLNQSTLSPSSWYCFFSSSVQGTVRAAFRACFFALARE